MVDSVMRVKDPSCNGFGKTVGGIDDQVNIPAFVERLALTILIVDSLSCS